LEAAPAFAFANENNMSESNIKLQKEAAEDLAFFAEEIAYIETHDIADELDSMPEVHFEISPNLRRKRYSLDSELSAETLLNQRVHEKAAETLTVSVMQER